MRFVFWFWSWLCYGMYIGTCYMVHGGCVCVLGEYELQPRISETLPLFFLEKNSAICVKFVVMFSEFLKQKKGTN